MTREIRIVKAMNGYIANVGCQTLVFEKLEFMVVELTRYLSKPEEVEKEYISKYGDPGFVIPTLKVAERQLGEDVPMSRGAGGAYGG